MVKFCFRYEIYGYETYGRRYEIYGSLRDLWEGLRDLWEFARFMGVTRFMGRTDVPLAFSRHLCLSRNTLTRNTFDISSVL